MLNADLLLQGEATARKARKRATDEDESEGGFHFNAFLPIGHQLWKLDGLERQPMCLGNVKRPLETPTVLLTCNTGTVQGDWLSQAKPDIAARMAQYEEGHIEFAILSLVRDPLLELIPALAENVKGIRALSTKLDDVTPGWTDFIDYSTNSGLSGADSLISEPDLAYGLTQEMLDQTKPSQAVIDLCQSDAASDILGHRGQLLTMQAGLRMSIREEMQSNQSDEERAAARTCDYGARMQKFVRKMNLKKQSTERA